MCGSGAGVSVAACKIRGIRAATIHDSYTAHQAVEHEIEQVAEIDRGHEKEAGREQLPRA